LDGVHAFGYNSAESEPITDRTDTQTDNGPIANCRQKWLNRSRCRLECGLTWVQGTMY